MALRMKSIARIDQKREFETKKGTSLRRTRGWYVQVSWNRKKYTRFFSDGKFGSEEKARRAAIAWRDATESRIGKPQVAEPVVHPRTQRQGIGVSMTVKDGLPVYEASWVDETGRYGRTTVSIRKWGKTEAKRRALQIRADHHVPGASSQAYQKARRGGGPAARKSAAASKATGAKAATTARKRVAGGK